MQSITTVSYTHLDDIVDGLEEVANRFGVFNVEEIRPDAKDVYKRQVYGSATYNYFTADFKR